MNGEDGKTLVDNGPQVQSLFSGQEVRNCRIRRQDLSDLSLGGTHFHETDFQEVGLAGAVMGNCRLSGCSLTGAAMRGAKLSGAWLEHVEFRSCDAVEANVGQGTLVDVTFIETPLGNAIFQGAELVDCLFDASDLYAARFQDSVVVRTRFENRRLGNSVLSRADFSGAVILEADFRNADLADVSFRGALVVRTSFKDANLTGADFTDAVLVSSDFTGVNADDETRAALMRGSVRPGDAGTRVLDCLKGRDQGLVPVVHALLTGYVLVDAAAPVAVDRDPEPEPSAPDEPPASQPVLETSDTHEEAPEAAAADNGGKSKVARESKEVYERFKKIELD